MNPSTSRPSAPFDPRWVGRLRRVARLCCWLAVGLAGLALLGWWRGPPSLRHLRLHGPPMVPSTTLLLFLVGAGELLTLRRGGSARQWAGRGAAILALVIGAASLVEYWAGLELGFARFTVWVVRSELPVLPPEKPSLPSTAGLIALGLGVVAASWGRRRLILLGQGLAGLAGFLAIAALIAYAYGTGAQYLLAKYATRGLAVQTGVALLLLALALILARSEVGPVRLLVLSGPVGTLSRRMALAALLVPPLLGGLVLLSNLPLALALLTALFVPAELGLVVWTARAVARAHEAVSHSEEAYRALFEQAADGILLADLDGRYIDANDQACRILGMDRAQLIGRMIRDLIASEEQPRLEAQRSWMVETGKTRTDEWLIRHREGTLIPVEMSARILSDGRWQGMIRDIRARKEHERALQESHERERHLRGRLEGVAAASVAISEALSSLPATGIDALLQTIVDEARRIGEAEYAALGVQRQAGARLDAWVHSGQLSGPGRREEGREQLDDRQAAAASLKAPIRHRGRSVGELHLRGKRGGGPFSDEDQRLVEMLAAEVGTALESARLYQAEVRHRSFLSAVLEQLPEGVVVTDDRGRMAFVNPRARAFAFGREGTVVSLGNATIFALCRASGEEVPPEQQPLARVLKGEEAVTETEMVMCGDEGRRVPVLVTASSVMMEGERRGAVLVIQDISSLKELARLREEWVSLIAHDLRQPVGLIAMAVKMLRERKTTEGEPPAREQQAHERVRAAVGQLTRMVEDLVDVSRLEARQLPLARRELEVESWVQEVIQRAAPHTRGHAIRLDCAGPLPPIDADPDRIEQVLGNLLSNAAKYGDPQAEIVVSLRAIDDAVQFSVSNRGAGIAPEEQEGLFSRFHRGGRTRDTEGIGLGLYIARGLVEAHGGRLQVDSTPGETTTFRFTVPIYSARPSPPQERPAAS